MKKFIPILLFILSTTVHCEETGPSASFAEPQTHEESLFLRRIAEFYEEGEYELIKMQIAEFLKEHPDTHLSDSLYAFIGDLHVREENFEQAIQEYAKIENEEVSEKIVLNRLIALYHMGWYVTLAEECEPYLKQIASYDKDKYYKVLYLYADSLYQQTLNATDDLEKQRSYATKARPYLEELSQSPFADESLESLGYVCNVLGEYEKAADIYIELARRMPEQKEEMLFQAANLQVKFDKERAIQTYGRICHVGKERLKEASFNRMVLFYESEKYADILLAKGELRKTIPEGKLPELHFFTGRSHFFLQDYKRAAADLAIYVEAVDSFNETFKVGLLTLIDCAKHLDNMPIYNRSFDKLTTYFPKNEDIPLILLTRAMLHKAHKDYYLAQKDFEKLMKEYPSFEKKEELHYEHAELFYFTENWEMARSSLKEFTTNFPKSSRNSQAWRLFLNSSIQIAGETNKDEKYVKEQLTYDLDLILKQTDLLSEKEVRDYRFLQAKVHYEIDEFEEAIPILTSLLDAPLTDAQTSDAHLLLAYSYKNGIGDLKKFCAHLEQLLSMETEAKDPFQLRVSLYNAYLERSEKEEGQLTLAAEHLYQAHQMNGKTLQAENRRWLIDHYDQRIKKSKDTILVGRTVHLIETHIQTYPSQLSEYALELEPYLLRLSQLYGMQQNYEKQVDLLTHLQELYDKVEQTGWQHQRESQFDLAKTWHILGKDRKALPIFHSIVTSSPTLQTHIAAYSCLEAARIELSLLEAKSKENPIVLHVLTDLKNMKLQKTWEHEPLYLEAGLEYTELLSSMGSSRLDLLLQLKEDFQEKQDVLSQNYHQGLKQNPKKQHVYDLYMSFIEGEILLCKSNLSMEAEEAQKCKDHAREQFTKLSGDDHITPFLSLRVQSHIQQDERENAEGKELVDSQTNE